jgi:hypothetical protein
MVVLETVSDLRAYASVGTQVGSVICVESYATLGDACPARLFQVFSTTGTVPFADDGGIYITSSVVGSMPTTYYYFILQYSGAVDARWYGVLGGGTDDTAAIQNVLNSFMIDKTTGTSLGNGSQSGEILFPLGSVLSKPVWFTSNPEFSVVLKSLSAGAGGTVTPTWQWSGATYPTMFVCWGTPNLKVQGMMFDGSAGGITQCVHVTTSVVNTTFTAGVTAGTAVTASVASVTNMAVGMALAVGVGTAAYEVVYVTAVGGSSFTADFRNNHLNGAAVGNVIGSESMMFEDCGFAVPAGSTSAGILWGNQGAFTPDVGLAQVQNCRFQAKGAMAGDTYSAQRYITGGNVKDFTNSKNRYEAFKNVYAIEHWSGYFNSLHDEFLASDEWDIIVTGGAGTMNVIGSGSEAVGGAFIKAAVNFGQINVIGSLFECAANTGPSDDYVINAACSLNLFCSRFDNQNGGAVAKIKGGNLNAVPPPGAAMSQISSFGNYFANAGPGIPVFYDMSDNPFTPNDFATVQSIRVNSQGDYGDAGFLPAVSGQQAVMGASLSTASTAAGISVEAIGRLSETYSRATIPFGAFSASALLKDMTIFSVPPGTQIVQVIAQVTSAFSGTAGTLLMRIGHSLGGAEYLKDFSAASVANFGLAAADLGTELAAAGAVQGGAFASWPSGGLVRIRLSSSSGNLSSLTSGSVRIIVVTRRTLLTA